MAHYKIPNNVACDMIFFEGIENGRYKTVKEFLNAYGFALTADLLAQGFKPSDIEEAVNSGSVGVAHWPENKPITDMYLAKDEANLKRLEGLAGLAVKYCYGKTPHQSLGGTIETVGLAMGNNGLAMVGLVYAREQGKLSEMPEHVVRQIPEFNHLNGPLYIVRSGFLDQLVENMTRNKN